MNEIDQLDKKMRNVSLLIILAALIILIFWVISYVLSPEKASPILMSIGVALLLGGILMCTRIQYIIWMKRRY